MRENINHVYVFCEICKEEAHLLTSYDPITIQTFIGKSQILFSKRDKVYIARPELCIECGDEINQAIYTEEEEETELNK